MKVGDLVRVCCPLDDVTVEPFESSGIILAIHDNVEIPPLIEILWDNGYISKTYTDEVEVMNEQ